MGETQTETKYVAKVIIDVDNLDGYSYWKPFVSFEDAVMYLWNIYKRRYEHSENNEVIRITSVLFERILSTEGELVEPWILNNTITFKIDEVVE